jgi:hypothetical protein
VCSGQGWGGVTLLEDLLNVAITDQDCGGENSGSDVTEKAIVKPGEYRFCCKQMQED